MHGEDTLKVSKQGLLRYIKPSYISILLIAVIFGFSLIAGYINPTPLFSRQIRYYALVFLSFLFPFTMLGTISIALRSLNATGNPCEVISLGFANIYYGTYVQNVKPEWLFSFTSPTDAVFAEYATQGFGVPLWALLLSVIGETIFTIALLIKHVTKKVHWKDNECNHEEPVEKKNSGSKDAATEPNAPVLPPHDITDDNTDPDIRMGLLLQHQFNALFSPISVVFVYQLMVFTETASKHITVALTMLGAGAVVTLLLNKAVKAAENVLTSSEDTGSV